MPCGFRAAFFISIGRKISCIPVSAKSYICKFELLSFLVDFSKVIACLPVLYFCLLM